MSSRQTDTPHYVYSSTLHLCTLCMPCDLWCGLKMSSSGCFIVMSLYIVIDVMKVSGESAIEQQQQPFNGRFNPGRPVPEETFTRSHPSWSTYFLYHLSSFATVHGILFIQLTCLTVLSNNPFPGPLSSSTWYWTLNFILHAFLHPIIIIFSQHMPMYNCSAAISMLCHLHLRHTSTWPFSSLLAEVPPHFLSLQARSHFHATCCFAHNYCTTFLS